MVKIVRMDPPVVRRPEAETPPIQESRYIPDARLTFIRSGQTWTFDGSRVFIDGHNVNELIVGEHPNGAETLMGIAEGLVEYRQRVLKTDREIRDYSKFHAMVEALLTKCMEKLQTVYNQKMSGMKWKMEHGNLSINGINIHSFMMVYRLRPTRRAKSFLQGLRDKLASLQSGKQGFKNYEKLKDIIDETVREIDEVLLVPSIDGPEPLLPDRSLGR